MVAESHLKGVLRPGSGGRAPHHPLPGPRRRGMVRTVKILRIHLAPRSRNRVLVHLEDLDPLEIALDVMDRSGVHVGSELEPADLAHLQEDDTKWHVRQVALHLLSPPWGAGAPHPSPGEELPPCPGGVVHPPPQRAGASGRSCLRFGIRAKPHSPPPAGALSSEPRIATEGGGCRSRRESDRGRLPG